MRRVLLLIPSTSYRASDFLEAATRLDVKVVVGSDHRQVLEFQFFLQSLQLELDPLHFG